MIDKNLSTPYVRYTKVQMRFGQLTSVLLILSLQSVLSAQHNNRTDSNCLYQEYYEGITASLTEKHSNDDWDRAHEIFADAFNMVATPYGQDLEEALEVSVSLDDDTQTKYITEKLLLGGIPSDYFRRYPSIINSQWWKQMDFVEFSEKHRSNFDTELLNRLLSLRTKDSLFNIKYHRFRKGEELVELDYLINESTDIYREFNDIVSSHGFPSELNTGYLYRDNKIQTLPTQVVLIHIQQLGEPIISRDFSYTELVCDGHLTEYQHRSLLTLSSIGGGKGTKHEMTFFFNRYKGQY